MEIGKMAVTNPVENFQKTGSPDPAQRPVGRKIEANIPNPLRDEAVLSKNNAQDVVDTLNSAAKSVNKRISFHFNENANRVVMKVLDRNTNEVIREIPQKEMIKLLEHIHEMIGMFVDESR